MILLHVVSILATLLVVLYADKQGLQYMRSKVLTLPRKQVRRLHRVVAGGLAVIILTGSLMVYEDPGFYFAQPLYWAKMCFVLVLIINAIVIGRLSHLATATAFRLLSLRERRSLLVSGSVSAIAWFAAIVLGLSLSGWW